MKKREFDYSNVSAYLVAVAVSIAVGQDLYDYLCKKLFKPLGIEKVVCRHCLDGFFYGASGMKLTVNDVSKIGLLLCNKGVYEGKRILSEEYVKKACSLQQENENEGYGYFLWKYKEGVSINGKFEQKCYILPEENLVITYLSHIEDDGPGLVKSMENYLL